MSFSVLDQALYRLEMAGKISAADRLLAQRLASVSSESPILIATAVVKLAQVRADGHSAVPLNELDNSWASLISAPADEWLSTDQLRHHPLISSPPDPSTPLVIDGDLLYFERFWRYEMRVAKRLSQLSVTPCEVPIVSQYPLDESQEHAVRQALQQSFSLISGGPGTGKTTVAAAIIASVLGSEVVAAHRIALAAPTGKAAARLEASLSGALRGLTSEAPHASTLHRLLGWRRAGPPRHNRHYPLPFDVLLVDEASMVDLELMALLLDALPARCRLILLGDVHQLSAVGVGNVLPAIGASVFREKLCSLRVNHRFGHAEVLPRLADAVVNGDADTAEQLVVNGGPRVEFVTKSDSPEPLLDWVSAQVEPPAGLVDPAQALAEANRIRILTAHRYGVLGAKRINQRLRERFGAPSNGRFAGELLQVTGNDYQLGLFNGDQGVAGYDSEQRLRVLFDGADGPRWFDSNRLSQVETAWALTVHKSQGSEFDHVVLLLADEDSPLANRQTLYTGITRARERLTIVGTRQALRSAVDRQMQRFSGLAEKLDALAASG